MAIIAPKVAVQSQRHPPHGHAHSHTAFPPNANPTVVSARVLAVALLLIALVSILGLGSMSFDPDPPSSRAACGGKHVGPGTQSVFHEQRNEVYDKMDAEFNRRGADFLFGNISQDHFPNPSDIFKMMDGVIEPKLTPARVPVRTNVLHLDPSFSTSIREVVEENLKHHFHGGVWYQDSDFYHVSLFQSSSFQHPMPATKKQVDDEARAVHGVCKRLCPIHISLDRVIMTADGVLLGCWQVLDGTDPAELRDELREALPRSPRDQKYNRVILHTTFARITQPPIWPDKTVAHTAESAMLILRSIVAELNQQLCRLQTMVNELWFVEELDILALALQGSMRTHKFNLTCLQPDWVSTI